MPRKRWPQPTELYARQYRRHKYAWDREQIGHYDVAGFGYSDGFHGAYAERPEYIAPRARLDSPRPEGSGWPAPVYEITTDSEERHLRAFADRDLARSVDVALYHAIGEEADHVAVYADDAVVTLRGVLAHPEAARRAFEAAWNTPGVADVRSGLRVRR